MKLLHVLGAVFLTASMAVAQSSSTGTPAGQTQPSPKGTMQGMKTSPKRTMQGMNKQKMAERMAQMDQEVSAMRQQVEKMRTDAGKVSDANTKAALLDNADMWQQFLDHMSANMKQMQEMHDKMMMHKRGAASGKPGATTPTTPQ